MTPEPTGEYEHFDRVPLSPPALATGVEIELLYQPTSWEYIQFLYLANTGEITALGDTGSNMLAAWREAGDATTRMAEPHVMTSLTHALPEPGFTTLLAGGLLGVCWLARRRHGGGPPRVRASRSVARDGLQSRRTSRFSPR